jgi:DGQHR domain-containing protein
LVRALRTQQGDGEVYSFFIRGSDVVRVADISRVERGDSDELKGFQRPEIKSHVRGIIEYLNQRNVLFPNAIILAMSRDIWFTRARGPKPKGLQPVSDIGTLSLPLFPEGKRCAWIVDGQQRSLALAQTTNNSLPVPVIGFVSDSLEEQREQFILVNKAKPLPGRLINELLPETRGMLLPRELSARKLPSELVQNLHRDPASPFYKLIRRKSDEGKKGGAVVNDTALIQVIRNSISNPLGALAPYRGDGREAGDVQGMYQGLLNYWTAVKEAFPDAWGLDPRRSRLMHSAGIQAMGVLMDRICARVGSGADVATFRREIDRFASHCRWTKGHWEALGVEWNEIESTPRDIKRLQNVLVRAYTSGLSR